MTDKPPQPKGWQDVRKPKSGEQISPIDGIARTPDQEAELNRLFAKCFRGRAGDLLLEYLRSMTKDYILGDGLINTDRLLHLEGQRFHFHIIETRVKHGRQQPQS